MLARGLIISRRFVQVRTTPKHRSTHIPNYQSSEHESNQHDEIPVYPQEHFAYHKRQFWHVLCLKRIGLPCCTFVTTTITCSLQIILLSNYSATYNFSTCRHYLTENHLSFPSAPRWVCTLTYQKGYNSSHILVGHQCSQLLFSVFVS